MATQDGITLYASYWPPTKGGKRIWGNLPGDEDPLVQLASTQTRNEVELSEIYKKATFEKLRDEPWHFFRLIPIKLFYLMIPFDWEIFPHSSGSARSINIIYVLVLLCAFAGVPVAYGRTKTHVWLLWVIPAAVLIQSAICLRVTAIQNSG